MGRSKTATASKKSHPVAMRPLTPEARENQMIAYAEALAEQQLRDGTASSQVITHYLKLGSSRERLEQESKREEVKLLRAKTESIESSARLEDLYRDAMTSMKRYQGRED